MKRWLLIAAVALPLGAGHTAYWFWATQQLQVGFDRWVALRRASGLIVQAGTARTGGWPGAATLSVAATVLEERGPGGALWQSERIVLRVDLHNPTTLHINSEGNQRLRLPDAREVPFSAALLRVTFPLNPGAPVSVDVEVEGLQARLPADEEITLGSLTARGDLRPTAPTLTVRAKDIRLPMALMPAFGGHIDAIALDAALNGAPPLAAMPFEAARHWRDTGGKLEIAQLHVKADSFAMTGDGSLTLDAQLQPVGSGTARISGHAALLDALVTAHLMEPRAARGAKAMLNLLARPDPAGGPGLVEVPVALRDRTLSLHQFAVLRFPALIWPGR